MKNINYNGSLIYRERIETASRGYTLYTIYTENKALETGRLYAAKFAIDRLEAGDSIEDIKSAMFRDGVPETRLRSKTI